MRSEIEWMAGYDKTVLDSHGCHVEMHISYYSINCPIRALSLPAISRTPCPFIQHPSCQYHQLRAADPLPVTGLAQIYPPNASPRFPSLPQHPPSGNNQIQSDRPAPPSKVNSTLPDTQSSFTASAVAAVAAAAAPVTELSAWSTAVLASSSPAPVAGESPCM